MVKVVMVRLDGTDADDLRLAAVERLAGMFESYVIGLFLNVFPPILPIDPDPVRAETLARLNERALATGDRTEMILAKRLEQLNRPCEIRRIDLQASEVADIASREARSADAFVALRLNGGETSPESEDLVEGVLFGSGRHLVLVPDSAPSRNGFDHVLIGWNGSREATRAMAEALPYLHKSRAVTVVVVARSPPVELDAVLGREPVRYLRRHGIEATLERVDGRRGDVASTLVVEAERLGADLIVLGGYGHSRLREWLLGGVTYHFLRHTPVPLLVAH